MSDGAPVTDNDPSGTIDESTSSEIVDESTQSESRIPPETSDFLTKGFSENVVPVISNIEQQLLEIKSSQQLVLDGLAAQRKVLQENEALQEIVETMSKLPVFHQKLLNVRKDMMSIVEKTAKMKKRVEKLESKREKFDRKQEHAHQQAQKFEESLLARPANDLTAEKKAYDKQ